MGNYLSEVFLETVGLECTEEKVEKGLKKCEEILERRLEGIPTQIGKFLYFFETDGVVEGNLYFREVLDLWDVVKEFAEEEKYSNFEIIKVGRIFNGIYRNNK